MQNKSSVIMLTLSFNHVKWKLCDTMFVKDFRWKYILRGASCYKDGAVNCRKVNLNKMVLES